MMKSRLGLTAAAMFAAAASGLNIAVGGAVGGAVRNVATMFVPAPEDMPSRTGGSSRNGGFRGGNRRQQRAAQKRRNVIRHRKACRG